MMEIALNSGENPCSRSDLELECFAELDDISITLDFIITHFGG